jgi:putative hydrolase of the HAD superfamily
MKVDALSPYTGNFGGLALSVRAVIFDYGMVLTGEPDPAAHDEMVRITGLTAEQFERFYWADRHAYDEGKLTGVTFFQKLARDAGLSLSAEQIEELNRQDARMWTTQNPAMLAWQRSLKAAGIRTAILSNMGDSVLEKIKRDFQWIDDFDVLVWSFQLHMAKPDAAIYKHALKELGTRPEETMFIDDKRVNIEAAQALGMQAFEFTTVSQLRSDLERAGCDGQFPLPDPALQ